MIYRFFTILVCVVCLLQTSGLGAAHAASTQTTRPQYYIKAAYDQQKDQVTGNLKVKLPTKRFSKQREVYFRLYPNAFRKWRYGEESKPKQPGSIDVTQVKVNGVPVKSIVRDTVMKVELSKELANGQSAQIEMDYQLHLPRGGSRLNTYKQTAFLAQWYPMLAVKDQEGWHTDPYTSVGDPFYTVMSDFDVTFKLPKDYKVISTAEDHEDKQQETIRLQQKNVRDFVAVLTKDYQVKKAKMGNVEVNMWYMPSMEDVSTPLLKSAVSGMEFFSKRFGNYPYPEVDVVLGETGYGIAGMEYPGLVTSIPKMLTEKGESPAVSVVVHELAHQWWYGVVGNNQAKEPWLDEGLTTFSEFLYMKEKMKEDGSALLDQVTMRTNEIHQSVGITSAETLYKYPDSIYGMMVYIRPAAMLFQLSEQIGQDKVMEILHTYYHKYRFQVATTADFIQVANQVAKQDLTSFFGKWLYFKKISTKQAG